MPAIHILSLFLLNWLCTPEDLYAHRISLGHVSRLCDLYTNTDSLNITIADIEKNIHQLKESLAILQDQLEYLHAENSRYQSQKSERKKIEEQIRKKDLEILAIEFKLRKQYFFLTEARQISFQPLDKQEGILKILNEKIRFFEQAKISKDDLKKDLTPLTLPTDNYFKSLPFDCGLTLSEDQEILATRFIPFFSHTPANLEAHFKEREFVESEIRLLRSRKKYFMEIRLVFNTSKAQKTYGLFEAGNPIKLILLDGTYTYLNANASNSGIVDEKAGTTIYQIQCPLSHDKIKLLKKNNPDRIIILWEGGFEDFDIYHVDAIQKLFKCLE
ncbi:MAG: hypothetical protein JNK69_14035 [Saprospiraceae bacterium]|nr:hypothetical protein [Saprospiraceae bacterium]MCC6842768.1 hypothetical protein [Saprospiraceae bacterium]HRG33516.1 hypothetical protein [Saprospiraceae bacterium]